MAVRHRQDQFLNQERYVVHLKSLYLKNFRNFKEDEVHFNSGLNAIYGNNAQGKTNLLEAIYLIATGRSFRTNTLLELIREQEPFFFLEAQILRDEVIQTIKLFFDGQNRRLQIDSNEYNSFHPLLGLLPSVLYTPYDIELIMGPPAERRRFLNLQLAQSDPLYVHHLTCFWRAMKQRNCLLKSKSTQSIECWEEKMVQSAEYIIKEREKMLLEIKQNFSVEPESHDLIYQTAVSKQTYQRQLEKNRTREMELGLTLVGPHRDDLLFLIQGKPARFFASEGQKKTLMAAIKFAEWRRLTQKTGSQSMMGFDDLDQHLDEIRQKQLQEKFSELGQVFITSASPKPIEGHVLRIENGTISF